MDKDKKLDNFRKLYESDTYKKVTEEIRNNDDYAILELLRYDDIEALISLPNFRLTQEKLDLIIRRYRLNHQKYNCYYEENKNKANKQREKIIGIIIHKAKNKEEYKEILEYVKYFAEHTDLEKERLAEIQNKKDLAEARTNFSTMLYNFNEYLQETEPGRKLIKNIDFEKNN